MMRRSGLAAVIVLLAVGGLCVSASAQPHSAPITTSSGTARLGFIPCADADAKPALAGSLCARTTAPLDAQAPSGGRIELFVRLFPATTHAVGQLWLVAGGPGESGASFYPLLARLRAAAPGYDLVIPDHRGTGFSTRLCPAEEAPASPGARPSKAPSGEPASRR
jgi:hypothetical protein